MDEDPCLSANENCKRAFNSIFIGELLTIEVCSGCGVLSAHLKDVGFDILPIDHAGNKHQVFVKYFQLDITVPDNQTLLFSIVETSYVFYIHGAPPCGTSSRAREKPLPSYLKQLGAYEPKPLRNALFVRGLAELTGIDKLRVEKANEIYDFIQDLFFLCHKLSILFTIENPRNSWMWLLLEQRASSLGKSEIWSTLVAVSFQHCMVGGNRDKWSTWLCSDPAFSALSLVCDGNHTHLP